MHAAQTHLADCAMDGNGSNAQWKPCPVQTGVRYTVTFDFVLLTPGILYRDIRSESAIAFSPNFSTDAEERVDSPPPRPQLTA